MREEIEKKIKENIPYKLREFPKLESGEPYQFYKWDYDNSNRLCMYYYVTGGKGRHQKRVPINELTEAVHRFLQTGVFTREDFRELCPTTRKDGECGFAVIGRILEFLFGAEYQGRGGGFRKS